MTGLKHPRLPVTGKLSPEVCGNSEALALYLSAVNALAIQARIGEERVVRHEGNLVVTEGERYTINTTQGARHITGGRYLWYNGAREIIGAINITRTQRGHAAISNIYVRADCRRQGLATKLLAFVTADYRHVSVDKNMTEQGAAFFGYVTGPENTSSIHPA